MIRNPHLSEATAAGTASDVAVEWDRGNDQWWDWYMSLADGPAPDGPLVDPPPHDPGPAAVRRRGRRRTRRALPDHRRRRSDSSQRSRSSSCPAC